MSVLILPTYKVIPDGNVWVIEKEKKGEFVNEWDWKTKEEAEAYLDRLVKMGICQRG